MKIKGLDISDSLLKARQAASSKEASVSDLKRVIDLLVTILELVVA
jgi:hypothetical protein